MIKKIKNSILALMLPLMMAAPAAVVAPAISVAALGQCSNYSDSLNQGINVATGQNSGGGDGSCGSVANGSSADLAGLARKVVNVLSVVVGIAAVVMIIVGGFRYITSGGDSSKVGGAKNTLIYAIVGLVIVALAQFIVHFVLQNATGAAGTGLGS